MLRPRTTWLASPGLTCWPASREYMPPREGASGSQAESWVLAQARGCSLPCWHAWQEEGSNTEAGG